jgi:dihydrodipicolinate synthase/N-acetylneuraminate lyase
MCMLRALGSHLRPTLRCAAGSDAVKPVDGIQVVLNTPFHDDGSVDYPSLRVEIDHVLARGAKGVVIAMVSEVLRLSDAERKEVAAFVCSAVGGRGTTTISVGAESARSACEFARHAEEVGADALMAIPPLSVAAGDEQLTAYYESIIAASALPLIVQDASGYVGRPMSIALQAGLMQRHGEHRVMFKPEAEPIGQRLSELRDATQGRARVFEGSGGSMLLDSCEKLRRVPSRSL